MRSKLVTRSYLWSSILQANFERFLRRQVLPCIRFWPVAEIPILAIQDNSVRIFSIKVN
jgi:hypothetical protein